MNQRFIAFNHLFEHLTEDTLFYDQGFLIENQRLEYYIRSNYFSEFFYPIKDKVYSCAIKSFNIQIIDIRSGKMYDPAHDLSENLRIKIKVDGGNCLFSFETNHMKPYDENLISEKRLYTVIYVMWIVFNLVFGLIKAKREWKNRRIDELQAFQTYLALCINIYISKWHDLFIRKTLGDLWFAMAVVNVAAWTPSLCVMLKFLRSRVGFFWRLGRSFIFLIGMQVAFAFSHRILMAVFISIPWIDLIRNFIPKIKSSYDIFLYIGILFPNLVAFSYLLLYEHNFARIAPQPNLAIGFYTVLFFSYIILPLQLGVRKLLFLMKRSRNYVGIKSLKSEVKISQ